MSSPSGSSRLAAGIRNASRSTLLRTSVVYGVTNIVNALPPFLLLPLLTRTLTKAEYGIVSNFQSILLVVVPILSLNVSSAVSLMYYRLTPNEHARYVGTTLWLLLPLALFSAIATGILMMFKEAIFEVGTPWLLVAIVAALGPPITGLALVNFQVRSKPIPYGLFRACQTCFELGLSIFFVLSLGLGWQGRVSAIAIAAAVFSVIAILVLRSRSWISANFSRNYARHAIRYGLPLIPHVLGGVAISVSDRMFITTLVGIDAVGVYGAVSQIAAVLLICIASLNEAWVPWLYAKLRTDSDEGKRQIVKVTYGLFLALIAVAVSLGVLAPKILSIVVGKDFQSGAAYIIWLALGHCFNGMYRLIVGYIFYREKTSRLASITFSTACLNMLLSYTLIKANGTIGGAQAYACAQLVCFVLTWIVSARTLPMPWLAIFKSKAQAS